MVFASARLESLHQTLTTRAKRELAKRGYRLSRREQIQVAPEFWRFHELCHEQTMTSIERMVALHDAVRHVVAHEIPGDFVECGVWRGGSSMLAALTFAHLDDLSRDLYLFDTFDGMPEPSSLDLDPNGQPALGLWEKTRTDAHNKWCYASLEEVTSNMANTSYPQEQIHLVKGKVEQTLPDHAPQRISILRLDTDWYESTLHELRTLFPRLADGGVLILDDYDHWKGAKQAVDEWLRESEEPILLHRIDHTARIGVKAPRC